MEDNRPTVLGSAALLFYKTFHILSIIILDVIITKGRKLEKRGEMRNIVFIRT